MKKEYLRVGEAAKLLKVTPQTVRKYRDDGLIKGYKTPGGQTLYNKKELEAYLYGEPIEKNSPTRVVHYARSSNDSKKLIESQLDKLRKKYGEPLYEIRDTGSGLNENRKGLSKLMDLAEEEKVDLIRVTQKDRLSRFGNKYLERFFNACDVKVEVAFENDKKTLNEELMDDFMSLIASFSGKFYRMRGYAEQEKLLKKAENIIDEKRKNRSNDESETT